jgi:hypothetical protein
MAKKPNPQPQQPTNRGSEPLPKGYEKVIANWTRVLGASTIALVIATGVSAYFLYETDQTIKKQVGAVGIQLRAYIGLSQILYIANIKREADKPDVFIGASIGVIWKNFGATPAGQFEYWVSVKWQAQGTEPDFSNPSEKLSDRKIITVAPGIEMPSAGVFTAAEDINKATAGNGRIFFWGHATYRDYIPDTPVRYFHFCMYGVNMPTVTGQPAAFNVYKPECNYSN